MTRFDAFAQDCIDLLEPLGEIRARKMFGGVGIYSRDLFFALVADGELFFKVDEASHAIHARAGAHAFRPFPDKPPMTGYWSVPVDVLESPRVLLEWAARAVEVARNARTARASSRPARARKPRG